MDAPLLRDIATEFANELGQCYALIRYLGNVADHGGPSNWLDFVSPELRALYESVTAPGEL